MNISRLFSARTVIAAAVYFTVAVSVPFALSQVRPVNDYGAIGLGQMLRGLQTTASVMMIGAHPDDEDSALLAYLARGENARTAYLSLTRGDGGQNIIGPELFEPLGVIRTEELLQARRLDGAEQYFTRAYDYGFSKTLDEAKSKWPEDVIKCDVVRVIRLFRPLVVISRFTGTPRDGHGQHQYAGYISPIGVKAAADPSQCTNAGPVWQVKKFYVEQGFGNSSEPTLRINTGQYDPILGRTYLEIAMEGRSQHRSQGEGRIEFHGDSFSGLNLVGADINVKEKSIFEGLEGGGPDAVIFHPPENANLANPRDRILPSLSFLYKELRSKLDVDGSFRYPYPIARAAAAIRNASGVQIDALAESETVVAGDDLMVSVKAFLPKDDKVSVSEITLTAPSGWTITKIDPPKQNNAAYNSREVATAGAVFDVKVPTSADVTQPYWLQSDRQGDLFTWPRTESQTLPFDPQQMVAHVRLNLGSTDIVLDQPVQYRFADPARGEVRREINVVPPVSVAVDHDLLIVPESNKPQVRRLVVSVTNNSAREQAGNVSLNIAALRDWKVEAPQGSNFTLKTRGAKASIPFDITIPENTKIGSFAVHAGADLGQARYAMTMNVVAYPHIQTHRYYTPADSRVRVLDLKTVPLNVGYVMGSGDEVPDAIRQMGSNVTMIDDIASADLSKFDTVVVGIRASEVRPDLIANNQKLFDYVKNGGNLIVQYQRGSWTSLAPYPVTTQDTQGTAAGSIARVVDENAPVKILEPQHPAFNFPNKITEEDFKDWVQERNAYNLVTFDPKYTPLLESHDAGEQENKGGLVVAQVGKGTWVYCSYSLFRQLPAGNPGAYRLFANLLSLPKTKS
jgi:LmbE family N-acetylglucosaminyl deacetylase